jgi:predicted phage-related endonuclease
MVLNAAQQANRMLSLGSSEIAPIMQGDKEKINKLWRIKIGADLPDDFSDNWPVRMGKLTEPLNLEWYERKQKEIISRRGDVVTHPVYSWARVTLDGWIDSLQCPIEAKHVGGREPIDPVIIDRYQPQCQYLMECTGADQCALSVIVAANEPAVWFLNRDSEYAETMMQYAAQFWQHVVNKTPPVDLPIVPSPAEANIEYDMDGDNAWANHADLWLNTRTAKEANLSAEKHLKALVPPDARKCFGYGVQITRNRAGYLSLRELRE